jgi:tetratricopeptide (TPR) repeat protein
MVGYVDGVFAFQTGRLAEAVEILPVAVDRAGAAGLFELEISAALTIAAAFSNLGDRREAAAWAERALSQARRFGWGRNIGGALCQLGRLFTHMQQAERAVEVLKEAKTWLQPLVESRHYAMACYYLGDAFLVKGSPSEAIDELRSAADLTRRRAFIVELSCVLAYWARGLSRLGRVDEALGAANESLALARERGARMWEVEALRSFAEINLAHPDGKDRSAQAAVGYLESALSVAGTIGGHQEKSGLLEELARAHEKAGDLAAALEAERAARREALNEQHRLAENQVMVTQVRHESERSRERAEQEAERAQVLQEMLGTLSRIRAVGHEITAGLDVAGTLDVLRRHLDTLVGAEFIAVYAFDAAGTGVKRHACFRGEALPAIEMRMADLDGQAAHVARNRGELQVEREPGAGVSDVRGVPPMSTLWFGPLVFGDSLVGVLTVQTRKPRAFGSRETLILGVLAGHVAVALANARRAK